MKHFRSALDNCQNPSTLQATALFTKTCLGFPSSTTPVFSTPHAVFAIKPNNTFAMFILTVYKCSKTLYQARSAEMPFIMLFLRDGIIWFLIVFGVDGLQMLVWATERATLTQVLIIPSLVLHSLVASRVLLNSGSLRGLGCPFAGYRPPALHPPPPASLNAALNARQHRRHTVRSGTVPHAQNRPRIRGSLCSCGSGDVRVVHTAAAVCIAISALALQPKSTSPRPDVRQRLQGHIQSALDARARPVLARVYSIYIQHGICLATQVRSRRPNRALHAPRLRTGCPRTLSVVRAPRVLCPPFTLPHSPRRCVTRRPCTPAVPQAAQTLPFSHSAASAHVRTNLICRTRRLPSTGALPPSSLASAPGCHDLRACRKPCRPPYSSSSPRSYGPAPLKLRDGPLRPTRSMRTDRTLRSRMRELCFQNASGTPSSAIQRRH
ncbi:hypothetical protein B0H15DRAFT_984812 [Mycena belliarum]|uniref:Uncharacterized protein n=1 Tax=Mycena belliarum TaxID=1033014 RepID=A0AAD6XYR6_9AGAR|nr:hypothetical protein B0H15DRAFT_984812 [Mycena belliae]